jgi:hypothetical protein
MTSECRDEASGPSVLDGAHESRRDVWSERELLRLIDSLSTSGHITDELAEEARTTLREEGFQPAMETLRTAGAFE